MADALWWVWWNDAGVGGRSWHRRVGEPPPITARSRSLDVAGADWQMVEYATDSVYGVLCSLLTKCRLGKGRGVKKFRKCPDKQAQRLLLLCTVLTM
jgi:hypothetical protein